jgi:hypothetical protein
MVGLYCYAMGRALPPLRNEPVTLLLLPMMVIAGVIALFLHPVLCCQPERSRQIHAFYIGFIMSIVIYGGYLWIFIPDGTMGLIILALVAGHLYGMPLFLAIVVVHLIMNRLVSPPATSDSI